MDARKRAYAPRIQLLSKSDELPGKPGNDR
jgi:hypothetical protein